MKTTRITSAAFIAGVTTLAVTLPVLAAERTYDVADFDEVSISEGLSAEIEIGSEFEVSAQSNTRSGLDRLSIQVRGDRLYVERDESWLDYSLFAARRQASVKISLPDMKAVSASSGSDVYVSGSYGASLDAEVSSGADLELDDVSGAKLRLQASSGADLRAEGVCVSLDVSSSSGANIRADELICEGVSASASSGADIRAHADETLQVRASSGGNIRISGNPRILDLDESSGGDIDIKN